MYVCRQVGRQYVKIGESEERTGKEVDNIREKYREVKKARRDRRPPVAAAERRSSESIHIDVRRNVNNSRRHSNHPDFAQRNRLLAARFDFMS